MSYLMKMVLLGRSGSGKTAVIESLLGTPITHRTSSFGWNSVHTLKKQNSHLSIIETPGLFAEAKDGYASKMILAESVYTFTPGPDAFGLVIRIGRFTPEERTMIDVFRETFGEAVFPFTVLIFKRLDDLKYDDVTLEEYLQESTPELKRILHACGGRYIGFDNTGTWESRAECGDKLQSMLQDLQMRNYNMVYTVAMLEDATRCQQKKEEETRNQQAQSYREMKEELKSTMRQEMKDAIRREMLTEQRFPASSFNQNTLRNDTTEREPSKLQTGIHTRQDAVSEGTINKTKSREGAAPLKHERKRKPSLKPEPTLPKVQENINPREMHDQDDVWVCSTCFHNNDAAHENCQECGTSKLMRTMSVEKGVKRMSKGPFTTPDLPAPKPPSPVEPVDSKPKQKVTRVNPLPKPPRHEIESGELRIVLLGKTGAGKSATANTILNETAFDSKSSMSSVTEKCQFIHREVFGNTIQIVDTPGLFDTSTKKEVIEKEIKKCIAISAPGPHAFLLVSSLTNRFTEEEGKVFDEIDDMFGEQVLKYMVIVFTGRDQIKPKAVEEHIQGAPDKLKQILSNSGGGYVTFNNRGDASEKEADVKCLLERIKNTVDKNGKKHFTSKMFQEAEEIIQDRIRRDRAEKEKEMRKEIEEELHQEMNEIMKNEREYYEKLHEANVKQMEDMKLKLNEEQNKHVRKRSVARQNEGTIAELVRKEMEMKAKKDKLVQQMQKVESGEKMQLQHKLASIGEEVKEVIAKRKRVEDKVTDDRFQEECDLRAQQVRKAERENIQEEDESTLRRFTDGIMAMGKRFLSLFM